MVLKGLNLLLTNKGRGSPLLYGPGVCCLLVCIAAVFYPPLIITVYDIKFCAIKNSILSLIAETRRHNRNSITSPRRWSSLLHLHTSTLAAGTVLQLAKFGYTELSINSDKHVSIMVTPIPSHVLSTAYRLFPVSNECGALYYAANSLVSLFSSSSDDYIDFVVFVCLSSRGRARHPRCHRGPNK